MISPADWERIRMTGTDLAACELPFRQMSFQDFISAVQMDVIHSPNTIPPDIVEQWKKQGYVFGPAVAPTIT